MSENLDNDSGESDMPKSFSALQLCMQAALGTSGSIYYESLINYTKLANNSEQEVLI
ncbi:hypothetical protein [Paenibacillus harenae]|uniref:hypothetical protein n=1 Tax=Paenibacillus harenae TaxID=306543 RepID=UPI0027D7D88D|nr:hypothetical protein [Paenibacillus harenae]